MASLLRRPLIYARRRPEQGHRHDSPRPDPARRRRHPAGQGADRRTADDVRGARRTRAARRPRPRPRPAAGARHAARAGTRRPAAGAAHAQGAAAAHPQRAAPGDGGNLHGRRRPRRGQRGGGARRRRPPPRRDEGHGQRRPAPGRRRRARGLGQAARAAPAQVAARPLVDAYGARRVAAMEAAHFAPPPLDLTARDDAAEVAALLGGRLLPTGTVRLDDAGQVSRLPGFDAGPMVGAGRRRRAAGPHPRAETRRKGARHVRRAGRQDPATGRRGRTGDGARHLGPAHGAGHREPRAHRA